MGIAAHRGFVERDLFTTALDELLQFSPNNRDQRFGYVPTAFVLSTRADAAAQGIRSGNAGFQHRPRRRDLPQALKLLHRAQPMRGADLSRDLISSPLVVR